MPWPVKVVQGLVGRALSEISRKEKLKAQNVIGISGLRIWGLRLESLRFRGLARFGGLVLSFSIA